MKKVFTIIICFLVLCINIDSVSAVTKAAVDITQLDIFEIQQAIDSGLLNYETLIKIYLERIYEYNSQYNAVITINENVIEEAKECDRNYTKERSILYCMPILVKDNIDVMGMPTTAGTKTLADSFPDKDAEIVTKLKDKGAIIIGKANMSEFAFVAKSSISSYGTVKNAYNINYSSYGSSGGSAVGVAASLAALSIGTDTNSSVRAPSSANNLYGMRPTFGLLSMNGLFKYDITRDTAGPITKTARENAILLAIMAGLDEMSYIDENSSLKGKVIGVLTQFVDGDNSVGLSESSAEVKEKFNAIIELLKNNNVTIVEINDFYSKEEQKISENTRGGWTMCHAFNRYIQNTNSSIKNFYQLSNSSGHIYGLRGYAARCNDPIENINSYEHIKSSFNEKIEKIFQVNSLDALIYPTTGNVLSNDYTSNCSKLSSVLGLPALSVPMGEIDGLYYGFDLVGLKNSEKLLYDIAINYNDINDTSTLPSIAPNLYDVPQEVVLLNDYYLMNNSLDINVDSSEYEAYKIVLDEVRYFYTNYNNYDDISEEANFLLLKLKNSVNILKNSADDQINNLNIKKTLIIITLLASVIVGLCIMIKRRNNLNNKMRKGEYI